MLKREVIESQEFFYVLDESEKFKIVHQILESPEFKDSRRYKDLLQYLVRETLAGNVPKEITVGTDFFQRGASFDPKEDPTVRVYLNNLRKKLEHYYLTDAAPHPYRLEIPRGHYQVEFVEAQTKPLPARRFTYRPFLIISAFVVCVAIGFFIRELFITRPAPAVTEDPIWVDFLKPGGKPTMIVLGDYFFLFERSQDGQGGTFVRNYALNSLDDFKQFIKKDPSLSKRFVQSDITFLRPGATWGLTQILPVFQNSPNPYSLKLASQFTVDDLKSNNIVFIGSVKALYSLHKFLHTFGITYSISPNKFDVRGNPGDSVRSFAPTEIAGGNYEKDYAVVAKGTGPEGSAVILLLGFADSGVIEAARAIMDRGMISQVIGGIPPESADAPLHFTMVVETEGMNQAIFKSQMRYYVRLHPTSTAHAFDGKDSAVKR